MSEDFFSCFEQALQEKNIIALHGYFRSSVRRDLSDAQCSGLKDLFDKHVPHLDMNAWADLLLQFEGLSQKHHLLANMWIDSFPDAQVFLSSKWWNLKLMIHHVASHNPNMAHQCLMGFSEEERKSVFTINDGFYEFWKEGSQNPDALHKKTAMSLAPWLKTAAQHCPHYVRQQLLEHIKQGSDTKQFAPAHVTYGLVFVAQNNISFSFVQDCMNVLDVEDHQWLLNACEQDNILDYALKIPSIHHAYERSVLESSVSGNRPSQSKSKM